MMGEKWSRVGIALLALAGVPILISGYAVNSGPPPNSTVAQLAAFGITHRSGVLLGGWLQIAGTVLCILFALAVVQRAGASGKLAGVLTLLGSVVLTCVGLAEVTGYALATSGDPIVVRVASQFIPAVQHGYSIVAAPLIFLPLAAVILESGILARCVGYAAFGFGIVFAAFGLIGMLAPVQGIVDVLSAVQGFWWIAAAISFLLRSGRRSVPTVGPAAQGMA